MTMIVGKLASKSVLFGDATSVLDQDDGLAWTSPDRDNYLAFLSPASAGASKNAKNGGSIGATNLATSASTTVVTSGSSPFKVDITWDASVSSAPAGFTTAVIAAVQSIESQITNPVTINIDVGYGEVDGSALGSNSLGQSYYYLTSVSYSQLVGALKSDATSATDSSMLASLPATSPIAGTYWITTAQAKALGLAPATGTSVDGFVGFSSTYSFSYNDVTGVAAGSYDFNAIVLHEITETMGRMMLTGSSVGTTPNSYSLLDLAHYSAPGVRDFVASAPGYFSADGGVTNLGNFNTVSGGDAGDWGASVVNDAFDAFSYPGVVNAVSPTDLTAMDAIGWNLTGASPLPSPPPPSAGTPTGVSVAAMTASLAAAQGTSGLNGSVALARISQTGGPGGDSYSYALSGAGAGWFTALTTNNVATLATSPSGAAGFAAGTLYNLAVTATDTSSGNSSAAIPVNVVVGSGGNDTIVLTSLPAIASSAVTFIYGLGGNDTIDATGMSGKQYIDGGTGADTMTGGSGANVYLYGTASDSTPGAMDVITNFRGASDLIDLSGLGMSLKYAGSLSGRAKGLGADSISWTVSKGNTYVYVNTTGSSETLGTANMEIELRGTPTLSSSNFQHA
jgi:Peptidase M10 serralysin C terminal